MYKEKYVLAHNLLVRDVWLRTVFWVVGLRPIIRISDVLLMDEWTRTQFPVVIGERSLCKFASKPRSSETPWGTGILRVHWTPWTMMTHKHSWAVEIITFKKRGSTAWLWLIAVSRSLTRSCVPMSFHVCSSCLVSGIRSFCASTSSQQCPTLSIQVDRHVQSDACRWICLEDQHKQLEVPSALCLPWTCSWPWFCCSSSVFILPGSPCGSR